MSSKLERAGILIIAIVFVVSTIGIGVFYVMQAQKDNKDTQTQASIQKALQESQKKPQEQNRTEPETRCGWLRPPAPPKN